MRSLGDGSRANNRSKSSSSSSRGWSRRCALLASSLARTRDRGAARTADGRRRGQRAASVLGAARADPPDVLAPPPCVAPFAPSRATSPPRSQTARRAPPRRARASVACLRGATGTGKTFVVAHVVDALTQAQAAADAGRRPEQDARRAGGARAPRVPPPDSRHVELFVSHFSLYVPESRSRSGRYVEKRSAVDHDLDALRHRATKALARERTTAVVVASVSCLYGLGLPARLRRRAAVAGERGRSGASAARVKTRSARRLDGVASCTRSRTRGRRRRVAAGSGRGQGEVEPRCQCTARERWIAVWPPYEAAPRWRWSSDAGRRRWSGSDACGARTTLMLLTWKLTWKLTWPSRGRRRRRRQRREGPTRGFRERRRGRRAAAPPPDRVTIWPRQHHITPARAPRGAAAAIKRELPSGRRSCARERDSDRGGPPGAARRRDVGLLQRARVVPGRGALLQAPGRARRGRAAGDAAGLSTFRLGRMPDGLPPRSRREWLLVADESHVMLPQLGPCTAATASRKLGLVAGGTGCPARWITARCVRRVLGARPEARCS